MKSINFLAIVSSLFIVTSCAKNIQETQATIEGNAYEGLEEITFEYFKKNPADLNPKEYTAPIDSAGNFSVTIPFEQISVGRMVVKNKRYDVVLFPNDNIRISIGKDSIEYSGKGAEKNTFLYMLSKNKKCSMHDIMRSWYMEEHELKEFYSMIDEYTKTRNAELDKFRLNHSLSKEFIDYFNALNEVDNAMLYANATIAYSRKNRIPLDSVQIPSEYKKHIGIKGLTNDTYLVVPNYMPALNTLIGKTINARMAANPSLNRDSLKLSIIMDSLTGSVREHYLLQNSYYGFSIYDNYDTAFVEAFNKIKSDPNCIQAFDAELDKFNKKKSAIGVPLQEPFIQTVVYDTSGAKLILGDVLSKSKGKVVYLDIWSLGCGPCIKAMPISKTIKEKLKEQPIEFVYITVDKYSDELWDHVFKVSQTHDNHYRFDKGSHSKLHELFNIIAVPTYMIIDKKGNLVSYCAERPFNLSWQENPKLVEVLTDLASENI